MSSLNFKKYIIITLILGVAFLLSPFKVYADGTVDVESNPTVVIDVGDTGASELINLEDTINSGLSWDFITITQDSNSSSNTTYKVSIDTVTYKTLSQEKKKNIMNRALTSIQDSNLSTIAKNKIYKFIESQDESTAALVRQLSNDVTADFASAYMWFKPFSGVLGIILGVFALGIFVALTLMVVIDLSYIVLPLVRDWLTPETAKGKPKFVSNEAWYAVKEIEESGQTNKNVLMIYFKKKVGQFVILSICILYLLSGQIYILIGNLMDMFRGILG